MASSTAAVATAPHLALQQIQKPTHQRTTPARLDMEASSRILALLTIYCTSLGYCMKRIVRLKRGLFVVLDSYYRPSLRKSLPFLFCLTAVLTAGITLQYIEQQLLCQPTQRAQ